jgi:hypothetical protein
VYCSSLPLPFRFVINIAKPAVKIANNNTIDATIKAVSPLRADDCLLLLLVTTMSPKMKFYLTI